MNKELDNYRWQTQRWKWLAVRNEEKFNSSQRKVREISFTQIVDTIKFLQYAPDVRVVSLSNLLVYLDLYRINTSKSLLC
jgi:hypothetical protein